MKKIAITVCALLGMLLMCEGADAGWSSLHYGGYQPWWNIFAKRQRCMSAEEERLQRFWHDYYDALKNYYHSLDAIDWVSYYKNHGYQINTSGNGSACGAGGPCGGCPRIQFAPVFVSPTMQWAVPGSSLSSPPSAPASPPPGAYGMSGPMYGMGGGGGMMPPPPPPGYGMPYGFMGN